MNGHNCEYLTEFEFCLKNEEEGGCLASGNLAPAVTALPFFGAAVFAGPFNH